jgi:hypothetical protein
LQLRRRSVARRERPALQALPAEREFLRAAFTLVDGNLPHPELLFSAPKKSGKTALAAMCALWVATMAGGPWAEVYCLANDFEQSSSRVFEACRRICQASPFLKASPKLPATGSPSAPLAASFRRARPTSPAMPALAQA